jgi:hypothetical protein
MLALNQLGVVLVIPGLLILMVGFVLILRPIVSSRSTDRRDEEENGNSGSL